MTSFAFILGVVPLVIATGAGAEMRQALGTVVFFGMLGVTFFGLFLTPVFYVTIRRLTGRWTLPPEEGQGGPRKPAAATPATSPRNPPVPQATATAVRRRPAKPTGGYPLDRSRAPPPVDSAV